MERFSGLGLIRAVEDLVQVLAERLAIGFLYTPHGIGGGMLLTVLCLRTTKVRREACLKPQQAIH